ncbi:nitrate reductase cytochrome c-type subunit [Shimia haliotis]|uniref:Periplasmic nitrate reductase, electron transfer subunit n=1 Tax=Shimia haliotis TaxID=1280847 RepID=A0A1I3ZY02_9RHOB|nr:nitrate reductase cytochrome c-type subunit [Shimia haliotis]SFK48955.1 periplasmic nitrate reductase subunit NapB [Shimia haliotis]
MFKQKFISLLAAFVVVLSGTFVAAQQSGVASLRDQAIDEVNYIDEVQKQDTSGRFSRNYRQQPPLIPHSVAQYQIDLNANQCLQCHDWTNAGDRGAPTLSMTHYMDREGNQLDAVAGTRWFCNQCHVPQANAPALVDNKFEPSSN